MSMQITPRNDLVLVKRLDPATKSLGGILLPDSAQKESVHVTVLAVGPGSLEHSDNSTDTADLKEGQIVVIGKYSGIEVAEGDPRLFVRQNEILGIINE